MADELVRTETRYKDVAKAMLGRIVVVDNVDNAVKIARKFDYGTRRRHQRRCFQEQQQSSRSKKRNGGLGEENQRPSFKR